MTHDVCFFDSCNSSRLITLDKCPCVRHNIGVGEVMRRIVGWTIVKCVTNDIKFLGNKLQLFLGQRCGIEHAIHYLREAFEQPESQAILFFAAKNAFKSLNKHRILLSINCNGNVWTIYFTLIEKLSGDKLTQKWYADDGNATGSVGALKVLLSKLKLHGPSFGYNVIK